MSAPGREVDAVIVGMGWTGGIIAAELTKAGRDVVGLERGPFRDREATDFADVRDELKVRRGTYTQDTAAESWTLRSGPGRPAFPVRSAGAFTPGSGLGGSSLLYGGHLTRLQPRDFVPYSSTVERYGPGVLPADGALADWGISYDELAPYYDRFEETVGVAGRAGNLGGSIVAGGNPFEGPRSAEFPLPPMRAAAGPVVFRDAARRLGLRPYPVPGGTLSEDYVNPDGIARPACTECGFCIGLPCRIGAKADATATVLPVALATGRLDLRTDATVFEVLHDGTRAYGVRYYDRDGNVREQRAATVILTAYALSNVRLLLLSGMGTPYDPETGTGTVGKNYSFNFVLSASALYAERTFASYIGSGANGFAVSEYNADNFDHAGEGFLGGGLVWSATRPSGPLAGVPVPDGTPTWGAAWKQALGDWYDRAVAVMAHGEVLPYRHHHLDLDPTYRDAMGRPLLRITFDWQENERRMYRYLRARVLDVVAEMRPDHVVAPADDLPPHFDMATYQSTHNTGGAIMGSDPGSSVVDPWLRMWDFPNVSVVGGSAFPHSLGSGPTGTICALAYRAADGILRDRR
jgi:gluconate 2-dehydrogenase alpha chain